MGPGVRLGPVRLPGHVIARLAALAVGIMAFAVTGWLFDPQEFGHFAVSLAAWVLFASLSEFGLRSFLIRERELDPEDPGRALGLALALRVRPRIPAPRPRPGPDGPHRGEICDRDDPQAEDSACPNLFRWSSVTA